MTEALVEQLPGLKQNAPMSRHTTYRIGGPAEYFYIAKTTDELVRAVSLARQNKLPIFILGKGSNILVSDAGIKGLVIRVEAKNCRQDNNLVSAEAGLALSALVVWSIDQGLSGLEFASGIPGAVGGAIRGNAGAFGSEMKDVVESVEVLTPENQRATLTNPECRFAYRDSIFKHSDNIVLSATFSLRPGNKQESLGLVRKYLEQRQSKQDYSIPSAGCVFKNPRGSPAAKMIDELGLKETRIGDAQISPTHANFIVNVGQARASDVIQLIALIKEKVKARHGIELETEIQLVGF